MRMFYFCVSPLGLGVLGANFVRFSHRRANRFVTDLA